MYEMLQNASPTVLKAPWGSMGYTLCYTRKTSAAELPMERTNRSRFIQCGASGS